MTDLYRIEDVNTEDREISFLAMTEFGQLLFNKVSRGIISPYLIYEADTFSD